MKSEMLIFNGRESKSLEFKEKLPSFSTLIKTSIAFANGIGGKIIVGIKDGSGEIVGITDKDRDRVYEDFPNNLYDSSSPTLVPCR